MRLHDVYNLTLGHVLDGQVMGLRALRPVRMQECYLMVDVAYQSVTVMAEMFERWFHACNEVIHPVRPPACLAFYKVF